MSSSSGNTDSVWAELSPFTGVVFVTLLLVGSLLVFAFDFMPPSSEIVEFYEDDSVRIMVGAYLSILSVFFLIWFSGSLKHFLQRAAIRHAGRLANVAFGGGVAAGVLLLAASALTATAAQRANSDTGISAEYATFAYDFAGALGGQAAPIAFAAMIYATAMAAFRTGVLPKWLGWISGILGIALITPYGWAVVVLIIPWIVIVSGWIYRGNRRKLPNPYTAG